MVEAAFMIATVATGPLPAGTTSTAQTKTLLTLARWTFCQICPSISFHPCDEKVLRFFVVVCVTLREIIIGSSDGCRGVEIESHGCHVER